MSNELISDQLFSQLTRGKNVREAIIGMYETIRDIPYAIIPDLISAGSYLEILSLRKGSCTPKHLLLTSWFERLGLTVLLVVYPFRWSNMEIDIPEQLRARADELPDDHHLACKVVIENRLVLVDATVDLALEGTGLTINHSWDGLSDTELPVDPVGDEMIFHPSEAIQINRAFDDREHIAFYKGVNDWLDSVRAEKKG